MNLKYTFINSRFIFNIYSLENNGVLKNDQSFISVKSKKLFGYRTSFIFIVNMELLLMSYLRKLIVI